MSVKEIESKYGILRYEEPIVYFEIKAGMELGFPEMFELISYAEELSGRKPYFVLWDLRARISVTSEGRRTIAGKTTVPFKRGTALWVNAEDLSSGSDFFKNIKDPDYPFKAFTDKEKAVQWLLQLPLEN